MEYSEIYIDMSLYHKLTEKEKIAFQLQGVTKSKVKEFNSMLFRDYHSIPKEEQGPFYGFNFYFTEKLLELCVEKKFIEDDRHNVQEAKNYLYDNIEKISDDLISTQLWRNEGHQYILDSDENGKIILLNGKNIKIHAFDLVFIREDNRMIKVYEPITYPEDEILENKNQRIYATKKFNFNRLVSKNIELLIKKEKVQYLTANMQFEEYVTNKFFDSNKNEILANKFLKERLKPIFSLRANFDKDERLVIHYDERYGTIIKNTNGKHLLRIPEEEQLNKIRSNLGNSSQNKIKPNK